MHSVVWSVSRLGERRPASPGRSLARRQRDRCTYRAARMVRSERCGSLAIVLQTLFFRHDLPFRPEIGQSYSGLMLAASNRQYLVHAFDLRRGLRLMLIAELATDPCKGLFEVGVYAFGIAKRRIEDGFHGICPWSLVSYAFSQGSWMQVAFRNTPDATASGT
jgi:hypothetical protein